MVPTPAHDTSSASSSTSSSVSTAATVIPADHPASSLGRGIPSPAPDTQTQRPTWRPSHRTVPSNGHLPITNDDRPNSNTPRNIPAGVYQPAHQLPPPPPQPKVIKIRDLQHIQTLVQQDGHPLSAFCGGSSGTGMLMTDDPPLQQMRYEISGMPIADIIEMVAALLTKITTTNDLQHDALQRNAVHLRQAEAQARHQEERQRREKEERNSEKQRSTSGTIGGNNNGGNGNMSPLSSSVLAFHGKNVPAITILSYLTRIHKYCPTTYEVFLSLLVYFDRMTERVNDMVVKSKEERRRRQQQARQLQSKAITNTTNERAAADDGPDVPMPDENDTEQHDSDETDSDLADDDDDEEMPDEVGSERGKTREQEEEDEDEEEQATYFVVDSFNIHRLIIAGVTCASKFFSDVFYTNSRYAKVCLLFCYSFFGCLWMGRYQALDGFRPIFPAWLLGFASTTFHLFSTAPRFHIFLCTVTFHSILSHATSTLPFHPILNVRFPSYLSPPSLSTYPNATHPSSHKY